MRHPLLITRRGKLYNGGDNMFSSSGVLHSLSLRECLIQLAKHAAILEEEEKKNRKSSWRYEQ